MRKSIIIIIMLVGIVLSLATCVFAVEPQITILGDSKAKPGETKTLTVKITSEDVAVGMLSGKIEKNANITNLTVIGKNSWNLMYNQETGVFNIYNAYGTNSAEVMDIQYKTSSGEGTANITLKDIKITTIDYQTKEVVDISKSITVEQELEINITKFVKEQEGGRKYIKHIDKLTTIAQALRNINTNGEVKVYREDTEITDTDINLGTGMTIKIKLNNKEEEYTAVVTGDLNGDGEMGDVDVLRMARYKAGLDKNLTGAYLKATDINKDNKYAEDVDLLKMVRTLVGLN